METRYAQKLLTMAEFASQLSALSTCRRDRVGCVVTSSECDRVLGIGYNGQPRGLPNAGCRDVEGHCGCVHAELNALLKAQSPGVLVTTRAPCETCAGAIVNSGLVIGVLFGQLYRDTAGLMVLNAAGVALLPWRALPRDGRPIADGAGVERILRSWRAGRSPAQAHKTLLGLERLLKSG